MEPLALVDEDIHYLFAKNSKETNAISFEKSRRVPIIRYPRTDDIRLFHEMLHWFHTLRNPKRKKRETEVKSLPADYQSDIILLKSKENGTDELKMWIYEIEFGSSKKLAIEMEEFHTIMGYVPNIYFKTGNLKAILYGDDLSENLYRKKYGTIFKVY